MNELTLAGIFSGSLWKIVGSTSAFGLFILCVLTFMSIVSWVIIFHKWRQYRTVEADNLRFVQSFERARSIADSVGQAKSAGNSPVSKIYLAGYSEMTELWDKKNQGGALQEKVHRLDNDDFEVVEMTMEKSLAEQMGILEKKVIFLASTANSAPFMGLLGTVVGIMESFWAIGERGSASLAVVAPGIAEALLATIVGLGAAIPAVIAFNWANNKLKFINDFANNFILSFIAKAKKEVQ
ncbi:MAG: MotA/TolQ/ExbB proton channel family protein [Candidatus Zixiibacteriota bacterium]|nr:MAG: MotA/TolQ/ExbB proton channel family protein [candidate division Zixibacteria bacterium]